MIRSLYVRVVLTFVLAVIVGLVIAFILTWTIFQNQLRQESVDEAMVVANELVDIYADSAGQSLDDLHRNIRVMGNYSIEMINRSGDVMTVNALQSTVRIPVTPEDTARVLNGQTLIGDGGEEPFVGRPVRLNGESYALFVMPVYPYNNTLPQILGTFFLIMFIIGSLIFVIASRFLVRPIRKITQATKRMSRGDFGVELNLNRDDELGALAQSFDQMARELRQIEQMRQDFVSNVSHEMQSPLTSIRGFAKALRDGVASTENRDRYLDIIAAESERLSRLSDNLLRLASLESKHHPFEPTAFALDEQIRKVVVALEPHWSAKQITIELELAPLKIVADGDQLNQVWTNLLGNAIKFTPEGGTVHVRLRRAAREVQVTIADTGIGISPDNVKHIFERFYKADRVRNRSGSGSGLGLAIAKKIVELHDGRIEVQSSPGEGTAFDVLLPDSAQPASLPL